MKKPRVVFGVAAVGLGVGLLFLQRHHIITTLVDSNRESRAQEPEGLSRVETMELSTPAVESVSSRQPSLPYSNVQSTGTKLTGTSEATVVGHTTMKVPPAPKLSARAGQEEYDEQDKVPIFAASSDGIREAMSYISYDIKECFEEWLRLGNPIAGKIEVQFNIAENENGEGDPRDIAIADSTLQHTALEGCVGNAVTTLLFEAPAETMTVNYPFVFRSSRNDTDAH